MQILNKTALFSAALALATLTLQAHAYVKANLVVQPLAATATKDAEDLLLHADDNGNTYLYVEQQKGALLSVYDVSNPAHIKLQASVETGARSAYDFVNAMGDKELIAFRDGSGNAVIDLHKAKTPRLMTIAGLDGAMQETNRLGDAGYLAANIQPVAPTATAPHMVQVVETESAPRLLATVPNVTKQATRRETGTTFLLGENGVTVVRQVNVEREYLEQMDLWIHAN